MTQLQDKLAYTVSDVCELTGMSEWSVRHLFLKEPGVFVLERPATLNKRRYRSLRIPKAVYQRFLSRHSNR